MAEVNGDLAVKNNLAVEGNAKVSKGLDSAYLELVDQKAAGVLGGAFFSGDWTTRDFTATIHNDFATSINLAANPGEGADFTLPSGEYYVECSAPAFNVGNHVARLADVTTLTGHQAPTVVLGTMENSVPAPETAADDASTQTRSEVVGRFRLQTLRTLEVQHRCQFTDALCGLGAGANFTGFYAADNLYTTLRIWQLRDDT